MKILRGLIVSVVCAVALMVVAPSALAVVLDSESRISVKLSDGTMVTLYAKAKSFGGATNDYYYLPFNLHVPERASDKAPEFLFIEYMSDEDESKGGLSGALMHFLVSWGPNDGQLAELDGLVKQAKPGARVVAAVPLDVDSKTGSFSIVSATMQDGNLARSQITSGRAPALPGGKAAVAASLSSNGAQLMKAGFKGEGAIADLSIVFDYTYLLRVPGAKGKIIINWSKIEDKESTLEAEFSTTTRSTGWFSSTTERTYSELRSEYESLIENEMIQVEFETYQDGQAPQAVQDAFFQYFVNLATDATQPETAMPEPNAEEQQQNPDIRRGRSYKYKQSFSSRSVERKRQVLTLSANMSIRYPVQVVGNLKSWYDEIESSHPMAKSDSDPLSCCLQRVDLADPFFNRNHINLMLDIDAQEIFGDIINYAGVSIRKQREGGNPFEDSVTFDKKFLDDNGPKAVLTYAGGARADKGTYEYKIQWGFRGGQKWPASPQWVSTDLPDVLLASPLRARVVYAEVDISQLAANDIARATVQIHYPRLGKELEENIQISTASGQGLVSGKIFTDTDAPGYAYRVILNHKRDGKLVLPWQANASDDYVYVMIPDEYLEEGTPEHAQAKTLGQELGDTAKEKVLEEFEALLK